MARIFLNDHGPGDHGPGDHRPGDHCPSNRRRANRGRANQYPDFAAGVSAPGRALFRSPLHQVFLLCGLLLAACSPAKPAADPAADARSAANAAGAPATTACTVAVDAPWNGAAGYRLRASAAGESCATAAITIEVVSPEGEFVFRDDYSGADLPILFDGLTDEDGLRVSLKSWLADAERNLTAGELPIWPLGAEGPLTPDGEGEFPFYPAEGMDQARYEAIRATNSPLFCFLQGAESTKCLTFEHQALMVIGLQVIPG